MASTQWLQANEHRQELRRFASPSRGLRQEEFDHHPAGSAKARPRRESVGDDGAESTIRMHVTSCVRLRLARRDIRLLPAPRRGRATV